MAISVPFTLFYFSCHPLPSSDIVYIFLSVFCLHSSITVWTPGDRQWLCLCSLLYLQQCSPGLFSPNHQHEKGKDFGGSVLGIHYICVEYSMYLSGATLEIKRLETDSMGKVILGQRVEWKFSKLLSDNSSCRLVSFPTFLKKHLLYAAVLWRMC